MIWLCVYKKTVLVCEIFPSPEVVLCVLTLYGSGMSWRVVTQLHFESHSWRDHTMRCCLGLKCIWFMLERLSESGPNLLTQQNRPAVIGQYIKYWRKPSGMLALLTGIQTRCIVGDRSPDFLSLYLNKNHCRAWRAHIVYRQRLSSAMLILHLVYFSKIGTDWNVHQTWIPTHHCGAVGWTVVHEPRGRWFDSCFLRCSWTRRPDPVAAPSHMCNCFHMEINKICHLIFLVFLVIKHLLVPACGDTTRSLSLSHTTVSWLRSFHMFCVFHTCVCTDGAHWDNTRTQAWGCVTEFENGGRCQRGQLWLTNNLSLTSSEYSFLTACLWPLSLADYDNGDRAVPGSVHIQRVWPVREDGGHGGLLLPQPAGAQDFPLPW